MEQEIVVMRVNMRQEIMLVVYKLKTKKDKESTNFKIIFVNEPNSQKPLHYTVVFVLDTYASEAVYVSIHI